MTLLTDHVRVGRRFQRAVSISRDLHDPRAIEGFVPTSSSADVLGTMARQIDEAGHGAFTWTGPYGSGKSSLAVALAALLTEDQYLRSRARSAVGDKISKAVWSGFPDCFRGWRVVSVVGRRDEPTRVLSEAMWAAGVHGREESAHWSGDIITNKLLEAAASNPGETGGVLVIVDEMGKFLEAAAYEGTDIFVFQQIAEAASRSNGRLVIVGILHQAFEEYAHRLSRAMRDEWSKVQGRFLDLAVNPAGEEQIELIGKAIESDGPPDALIGIAEAVAGEMHRRRPGASGDLHRALQDCWPLHPVVAGLLGPISRRRFGQNQRSVFGFLNSAEPNGFREFLQRTCAEGGSLYQPYLLWDYLRVNLEPSILSSPDGHRWAVASEAVERCEAQERDELEVLLLKTVALLDMFKERSGLLPSYPLLCACFDEYPHEDVGTALDTLQAESLVVYRKFSDSYAVYAGSDFDIEAAVQEVLKGLNEIDYAALGELVGLHPILAKRHYHRTGALRWFDVGMTSLSGVASNLSSYQPMDGAMGEFLLVLPTEGETIDEAHLRCSESQVRSVNWDVVVGVTEAAWPVVDMARELIALQEVRDHHPELAGDPVARREVRARLASAQSELERQLHEALNGATWYVDEASPQQLRFSELSVLASKLADERYPKAPRLANELLNRLKPSSNAVAAQNALLRRMVSHEGEPRLGIEDFPAEGGLLASLLEATGIYSEGSRGWRFAVPGRDVSDPCNLAPLWDTAEQLLQENSHGTVPLSTLYEEWCKQPIGLKNGLMPIMAVGFLLSQKDVVALYRDGVFQSRIKDVDVEFLAKDPSDIHLRWVELSDYSRSILPKLAGVIRQAGDSVDSLEPMEVARGLVSIYEDLHPWIKKTRKLSENGLSVRDTFRSASDPNKFLFEDIPNIICIGYEPIYEEEIEIVVERVSQGVEELEEFYPLMLKRLLGIMLNELRVPNASGSALSELRSRAENIREISGDFRLDAFVGRLAEFRGSDSEVEGIAGLAANKPTRMWVDADYDRAVLGVADLAQKFLRTEAYAHVRGRKDRRHAMAVMVGTEFGEPLSEEFDIAATERETVEEIVTRMESALADFSSRNRNVVLAALAEMSARYIRGNGETGG